MKLRAAEISGAPPRDAIVMRTSSRATAVAAGDRQISYIFSDSSVGRDMHTIAADAWQTDNFELNPVFLWAHDSDAPPIGRVTDLSNVGGKLRGTVEYAERDTYPFADSIFQLVKGRFINAVSTGWLPLDWSGANDRKRPGGIDFKRVELLEISQVPVPALPTALVTARAAGIDVSGFIGWAERVLDGAGVFEVKELEMVRRAAGAATVFSLSRPGDRTLDERRTAARAKAAEIGRGGFESLGDFLRAAAREVSPATIKDLRLVRAPTGANEQDPSAGGFLVPVEFSDKLIGSIYEQAIVAPLCDRLPSPKALELNIPAIDETSRADGSRWGGATSYWSSEAEITASSLPKFRKMKIEPKKIIGLCVASEELLADAPMLGAVIERAFASEFGFQLDKAIVAGPGAGQPLGLINSPATIEVAKDVGQPSATITAANVNGMWARMAAPSRRRAVWLVNEDADAQLAALSLTIGAAGGASPDASALYVAAGASGNETPLLKGRPVLAIEQAPTLGNVGDIILADLSQYALVDAGLKGALSLDVYFIEFQAVFRFTLRVDGQPYWKSPITPYNGGLTRSPFVALAAR